MLFFSYHIVRSGGDPEEVIARGQLYTSSFDIAKQYVQTVGVRSLADQSDLAVILQDKTGSEIWRGPYIGSTPNT